MASTVSPCCLACGCMRDIGVLCDAFAGDEESSDITLFGSSLSNGAVLCLIVCSWRGATPGF
jgi:hypothetical protein